MGRVKRPSLFESSKSVKNKIKKLGDRLVDSTLDSGMSAIKRSNMNVSAKRMPKYLQVTERRMKKQGVIDLKPHFARSNKRKQTDDGGWYLTIPIKRKARDMSRRMYEQLRAVDISPDQRKTVVSDFLYDRRRESGATMLNYEPKSNNIDKRKIGKNRHEYVAFRTVSNKSPANSWVINRGNITEDKTSKTMVANVNRLIKWKMKNGWK